jgi:hypothetical protein
MFRWLVEVGVREQADRLRPPPRLRAAIACAGLTLVFLPGELELILQGKFLSQHQAITRYFLPF